MLIKKISLSIIAVSLLGGFPKPTYAIDGHCVAFCDEPSNPEVSNDTSPPSAPTGVYTPPPQESALDRARKRAQRNIQRQKEEQKQQELQRQADALKQQQIQQEKQLQWQSGKIELLNSLKSSSKEKPSQLNLKSPLPDYMKGNKFSAPVDLRDSPNGLKTVNPATIQGQVKQKGLKIKEVPLPPDILQIYDRVMAFGADPYKGIKNHTDLILEALEMGEGDLDKSIAYLHAKVANDNYYEGVDALSYLEGLQQGAVATNAPVFNKDKIKYNLLDDHIKETTVNWPGPTHPEEKLSNPLHWRTKRTEILLEALEQGKGDRARSISYLKKKMNQRTAKNSDDAANAYYYLTGMEAYPNFLKQLQRQKAGD